MFITSRSIGFGLLGSILMAATSWAAPGAVEGNVLDAKGKPISGAEIRIEPVKEQSGLKKTVQTDTKGHYAFGGLNAGAIYRVSLVLDGTVKGAVNNVQPKIGNPTKLNFDLRKGVGSASKPGKHLVWMPSDTGSHLGGRWVEEDNQNPTAEPGVDNVRKAGNDAIRNAQMGGR